MLLISYVFLQYYFITSSGNLVISLYLITWLLDILLTLVHKHPEVKLVSEYCIELLLKEHNLLRNKIIPIQQISLLNLNNNYFIGFYNFNYFELI